VAVGADGFNVPIGANGARQDILWSGLPSGKLLGCDSTLSVDVVSRTSHSIVIEYELDWINVANCSASPALVIPASDCQVLQRETFELLQACPATLNGISCT
jgi:hypothetical protein